MYAIIKTGGKQYKAVPGKSIKVEKLDIGVGESIEFSDVLLLNNESDILVGTPFVSGVKVCAEVVSQARDKKVKIIKFKRRKHSMKQQGHRQYFTLVKVTDIVTV